MNSKDRKILNATVKKPRLELEYNDMRIDIQATKWQPTTKVDMILLAGSIVEKGYELDMGKPVVRTDLIKVESGSRSKGKTRRRSEQH